MSVIIHHAIVVTCYDRIEAETAQRKAKELCYPGSVTRLSAKMINNTYSFAVLPDGSKEGWTDSDMGAEGREKLISWLKKKKFKWGCHWAMVAFGPDAQRPEIIGWNDEPWE